MENDLDTPGELWAIQTKLNGLANLFQSHNGQIVANDTDWYGTGLLLRDLAEDLQEIRNRIESSEPAFGSKRKSNKSTKPD